MSVERWMGRLGSPKTRKDYRLAFNRFIQWKKEHGGKFADMSPDDLVKYQRECANGEAYEIEDMIQTWVNSHEGLRYNSKRIYHQTIRSFFAHNRAPLPKDTGYQIRGDKPRVPSKLRPEHIKRVVLASNPMYQSLILCMLEGAMGISELMYWNLNGWPSLYRQLQDENLKIVKVDLPGRKSNRNQRSYYTLIGGDALRALRGYLGPDPDVNRKAIFLNVYGRPIKTNGLNAHWVRTLTRLGIIQPRPGEGSGVRYGHGLHELRDNFRTLWSRSGANPDVGEYLMGHTVDPLGYNQIERDEDYTKAEYQKALPFLNVVSGTLNLEQNEELEAMKQELADLKQIITDAGLTKTINQQGQITKLENLGLSNGALEDLIRIIRQDRTKQENA